MKIVWDEPKRAANLDKHGVDFVDAAGIFAGHTVEAEDDRDDYGEARHRAIGMHEGQAYVVVFTVRGERLRIISAWKAGRHDRRTYQASLASRSQEDKGPDTR
jgi:uncharacterized protein